MNKKLIIISLLSSLCLAMTACKSADDSSSQPQEQINSKTENESDDDSDNDEDNISSYTNSENGSEEEWLMEISQTVTDSLLELTQDDVFIEIYTGSQELTDLIKDWQGAKVNTDEIYVAYISENTIEKFLNLSGDVNYDDLSSAGKSALYNGIGKSIPNYITAHHQGVNYVAATSILNYSVSYVSEYDVNNQIWFMPTDKDGLAVCVSFTNSGEDVITVNSSYLYYYGDKDLKETLDSYLSYMSIETEILD